MESYRRIHGWYSDVQCTIKTNDSPRNLKMEPNNARLVQMVFPFQMGDFSAFGIHPTIWSRSLKNLLGGLIQFLHEGALSWKSLPPFLKMVKLGVSNRTKNLDNSSPGSPSRPFSKNGLMAKIPKDSTILYELWMGVITIGVAISRSLIVPKTYNVQLYYSLLSIDYWI